MMTSHTPASAALPAKHRPETTDTSGTRPRSPASIRKVGTSSPAAPPTSVSPGRPPPPSAKSTTGSRFRAARSKTRSVLAWLRMPWVPASTV